MKDNKKELTTNQNNTIGYKGEVTIKCVTKNGKVKSVKKYNTGKIGLFTFICNALAGNANIRKYAPSGIMAYYNIPGTDEWKESLMSVIPSEYIPTCYYYDSSSGNWIAANDMCSKIKYSFRIPFTYINNTSNNITKLCLVNSNYTPAAGSKYPGETTGICAEINILEGLEVDSNTNILVYWELEFTSSDNA